LSNLGASDNPLRVAIVGSGPSGFYATEVLFKSGHNVHIDMLERLPVPFGLVRSGVAPDHPKLKQPMQLYDKIGQTPNFSFLGNVTVGRDVTVDELRNTHHAVIFTCGAETDRKLGVPGENLRGSYTATEFVGWYNGHPDFRDREFDLSSEIVAIIGQGNVAADVCRILCKTVDELKQTDIAEHALDALARSKVREIHVIGRRGPAQAKFTNRELRELGELEDCDPIIDPAALELNPQSITELEDKNNTVSAKNVETLRSWGTRGAPTKNRRCHFHFFRSPVALKGDNRLEKIVLEKNRLEGDAFNQSARGSGEMFEMDCGLLFRSIGYRGIPMPGLPFDDKKGVFPNSAGRIVKGNDVMPGLYCSGWIKRGPSGIIGTNRADSVETVQSLLQDLAQLDSKTKPGAEALYPVLQERNVRVISYADWRKIDAAEIERGKTKGKPREKFTRIAEMLAVL
jgi:ferredoxin/flavodoxin---NADP+ reductase